LVFSRLKTASDELPWPQNSITKNEICPMKSRENSSLKTRVIPLALDGDLANGTDKIKR
jgi:hypothetical protein